MKTLEEVLDIMQAEIDRATLEGYIARQWLRPLPAPTGWHFEEIDITRLQLICHLTHDIEVNDEGMDIVLSLLDQLYGLRAQMKHVTHAITQQPEHVRADITMIVEHLAKGEKRA